METNLMIYELKQTFARNTARNSEKLCGEGGTLPTIKYFGTDAYIRLLWKFEVQMYIYLSFLNIFLSAIPYYWCTVFRN
jgi:hypothetical protein